jgi:hypothetical protein
MGKHFHRVRGQQFQIDVRPVPLDRHTCFYAACIQRIDGEHLVSVCQHDGLSEVLGSSEQWALRNAKALIDSGAWHDTVVAA